MHNPAADLRVHNANQKVNKASRGCQLVQSKVGSVDLIYSVVSYMHACNVGVVK